MKNIRNTLISFYSYILFSIIFVLRFRYVVVNDAYVDSFFQDWIFSTSLIIALLLLVFGIISLLMNYKESKVIFKNKEIRLMTQRMKIIKLGMIPFYILNFILWALSFLFLFAASRGWILFSPLVIVFIFIVIFTYLVVVLTSYDGISLANIYYKNGIISRNIFLILVIMQLLFFFDIVATLLILFNRDFLDYQIEAK